LLKPDITLTCAVMRTDNMIPNTTDAYTHVIAAILTNHQTKSVELRATEQDVQK
jgi:hypothetical protein